MNDADPAGIEPTWRPSFNSAYRFKDGAKEWASHFKTTAGPNLMRVALWPDGMEWEVPGVLFEKPQADPPAPAGVGKKLSKTEKVKLKHPLAVAAIFAARKKCKGTLETTPKLKEDSEGSSQQTLAGLRRSRATPPLLGSCGLCNCG